MLWDPSETIELVISNSEQLKSAEKFTEQRLRYRRYALKFFWAKVDFFGQNFFFGVNEEPVELQGRLHYNSWSLGDLWYFKIPQDFRVVKVEWIILSFPLNQADAGREISFSRKDNIEKKLQKQVRVSIVLEKIVS